MNLFPPTRSLGVFVEDDRFSRGVEVISEGEPAYSDGDLFALEDHRLVGVVRHPDLKMPAREAESGRPEGLQLGHVFNGRNIFWLRAVTQISRRHCPFKITRMEHKWDAGCHEDVDFYIYLKREPYRIITYYTSME